MSTTNNKEPRYFIKIKNYGDFHHAARHTYVNSFRTVADLLVFLNKILSPEPHDNAQIYYTKGAFNPYVNEKDQLNKEYIIEDIIGKVVVHKMYTIEICENHKFPDGFVAHQQMEIAVDYVDLADDDMPPNIPLTFKKSDKRARYAECEENQTVLI